MWIFPLRWCSFLPCLCFCSKLPHLLNGWVMHLEGWNIYQRTIFHYGKGRASINISMALPAHSVSVCKPVCVCVCVLGTILMTCRHKDGQYASKQGHWDVSRFLTREPVLCTVKCHTSEGKCEFKGLSLRITDVCLHSAVPRAYRLTCCLGLFSQTSSSPRVWILASCSPLSCHTFSAFASWF